MFSRLLCFFASTPTCFTFMQIGLTHSMSSAVRNRGLSFPLKNTSAKKLSRDLVTLLLYPTYGLGLFCFLFFNMQLTDPNLISFWLSMCWLWRRSILKGTSTGTQWSMLWILIQIMTFGSSTILHVLPGSAAPPLPCLWPHFTSSSPPVLSSTVRWGRGLISKYTKTDFGCREFVSVGPIYRLHRRS